jgi:protein TonB
MKRQDISKLKKNQPIHFKIGLILAVGMALMAFNWTVDTYEAEQMELSPMEMTDNIEIIRTAHEQPQRIPPPAVEPMETFEPKIEPVIKPISIKIGDPVDPILPSIPAEGVVDVPLPPAPPAPKIKEPAAPPIFKIVEEMPRFGACTDRSMSKQERENCSNKALLSYIYQQIKYPPIARDNLIEGTVVVSFVVEKDGSISAPEILSDIGGGCGKEVIRVVNKMPDWTTPGMQRGRPVRVQMNLPVKFKLQ